VEMLSVTRLCPVFPFRELDLL